MKVIKAIFNTIFWVFLICFAVVFGTITYKAIDPFNKGYITADFCGIQPYLIRTDSMNVKGPERVADDFDAGDLVVMKLVDASELQVGDVASYYIGNPKDRVIITHRVVGIKDDGSFLFKGDANNEIDLAAVSPEQILGKYMFHVAKLGYVFGFISNHRVALIVIIVVWIIGSSLIEHFFGDDEEDEEIEKLEKQLKKAKKALKKAEIMEAVALQDEINALEARLAELKAKKEK